MVKIVMEVVVMMVEVVEMDQLRRGTGLQVQQGSLPFNKG